MCACAALLCRTALADTPLVPTATVRAEVEAPANTLSRAVDAYRAGDPATARQELLRILATGPSVPGEVRREALAWLAEILLAEQGPGAARNAMEALLDEAPDYQMDRFVHSPDACSAFEALRSEREALAPLPSPFVAPPPQPWPADVLLPGGVHYFRHGRPVPGVVFGGLQLAGAAASITTGLLLLDTGPIDPYDEDRLARYNTLQGVNIASTAVGWGSYLLPMITETARWQRKRRAQLSVGPTGVEVRGAF